MISSVICSPNPEEWRNISREKFLRLRLETGQMFTRWISTSSWVCISQLSLQWACAWLCNNGNGGECYIQFQGLAHEIFSYAVLRALVQSFTRIPLLNAEKDGSLEDGTALRWQETASLNDCMKLSPLLTSFDCGMREQYTLNVFVHWDFGVVIAFSAS